jgi:hypothetical protein
VTTPLERVNAVADAVLYEGYLLYPYRASAAKNRARWQFGVLVPPAYAAGGTGEHSVARTECLLEPQPGAVLHVRVRFLQVQARTGDGAVPVWDEAVERETDVVVALDTLLAEDLTLPITCPAGSFTDSEATRERFALDGQARLSARTLSGPYGVVRIRVDVANTSTWDSPHATREEAVRHSLVAAHTVLAVTAGSFLSLLEPPEWARGYAAECVNEHTWPVLVGGDETVLSSPIILYDQPEIAPESTTSFFDATEIDELLALRTLTLTEEEKREARCTDERARDLLDQVDDMPREVFERLHGALRSVRPVRGERAEPTEVTARPSTPWWEPGADTSVNPETDEIVINGRVVKSGSRVVLRPGLRRSDAQDMFLAGLQATVQGVFLDVDGDQHLAVTLDADPAAELQAAHGRYRYFSPDEVEPL